MPRNLFGQLEGDLTPAEREEAKRNWKMDSDQSHAYIIIYPIRQGDKVYYNYRDGLTIRPYPNPLNFGGSYGLGTIYTEEEAKEHVNNFMRLIEEWKGRGLKKIEIKWEAEQTLYEAKNEIIRETAKQAGKNAQLLLPLG